MKTFEEYLENHIKTHIKVHSVYGIGYLEALFHLREVYNNLKREEKLQQKEEWKVL